MFFVQTFDQFRKLKMKNFQPFALVHKPTLKDYCDPSKTVLKIIEEEINRLENKGKKPKYTLCEKKSLDLLVYITRTRTARMQSNIILEYYRKFFIQSGYRSILLYWEIYRRWLFT